MTNEEMEIIIGRSVSELAELKKKRACLRAKGDNYRKVLQVAIRIVAGDGEGTISASDWPSFEDIEALRRSRQETQERIQVLENLCREWGIFDR
ncbi:MAG: hypothetical protein OXH60_13950 [Rhodospirillales bacterium]|nr:hypothetical protein [Rhodospirillales bacterium]